SLRAVYGIDLRNPGMRWDDLADLVAWLPPGCALWRDTGGPLAWSEEVRMLSVVELRLRQSQWQAAGDRMKPQPEQWEPPPFKSDQRAKQVRTDRRAVRYMKRHGVKP